MDALDTKIATLAKEAASELGYYFVSMEWRFEEGEKVLQISIDKKDGISLDDIAKFADVISPKLDEIPELSTRYLLDCSSPGAERVVEVEDVFMQKELYLNSYMEVTDKNGASYIGTITTIDDVDGITVSYLIKGRKKLVTLKKDEVLKTQLRVKI